MERILIWGSGITTAMYFQWVRNRYKVLAVITNAVNMPEEIDGIPVITKEQIFKYEY